MYGGRERAEDRQVKVSAGIPRLAGRRRILPATGFRVLKKLRKRMVAGQGGAEGAPRGVCGSGREGFVDASLFVFPLVNP